LKIQALFGVFGYIFEEIIQKPQKVLEFSRHSLFGVFGYIFEEIIDPLYSYQTSITSANPILRIKTGKLPTAFIELYNQYRCLFNLQNIG